MAEIKKRIADLESQVGLNNIVKVVIIQPGEPVPKYNGPGQLIVITDLSEEYVANCREQLDPNTGKRYQGTPS